mmetsp:Transcript_65873/g.157171  ORF Transcript_65873/g.157171 Transcript_65873/m.157171 type:complete len:165 (-) Transcript_65873:86-580(-)
MRPAVLVVLQVALCCALQTTAAFQPGAATAFAPALRPVALRAETAQCPSIRARAAAPPMALQMQTGGATLQKPAVVVTPQTTEAPQTGKPFHVLLFNDPVNTREFVSEALQEIFGHSRSESYSIMQTAHTTGFAVCNTCDKQEADGQAAQMGEKNLMSSVVEAD